MQICARKDCSAIGENFQRCSACKHVQYCSAACQKADWSAHKPGCKIQQMLNTENDAQVSLPAPTPKKGRCTGCNLRFTNEDGDYPCDRACPDCGYATCESCSCHNSRGSCYCETGNFGSLYCDGEPRPYHMSSHSGKRYRGDYHPGEGYSEISRKTNPELWESIPRACGSCGEIKHCLKPNSAQYFLINYARY